MLASQHHRSQLLYKQKIVLLHIDSIPKEIVLPRIDMGNISLMMIQQASQAKVVWY